MFYATSADLRLQFVESITLTPSAPEDSTVGVVITSFAPAGDTDVHKTPQPVTLQWPKTTVEGRFKQYAEDENETAVSILVRVMNRLLSPFGKEVNTELLESF